MDESTTAVTERLTRIARALSTGVEAAETGRGRPDIDSALHYAHRALVLADRKHDLTPPGSPAREHAQKRRDKAMEDVVYEAMRLAHHTALTHPGAKDFLGQIMARIAEAALTGWDVPTLEPLWRQVWLAGMTKDPEER